MSLLNNNILEEKTRILNDQVRDLKDYPKRYLEDLYNRWNAWHNLIWKEEKILGNEDNIIKVSEKLESIGTDAKELFQIYKDIAKFLIEQYTDKNNDIVSEIQNKLENNPKYMVKSSGIVELK